MQLHSILPQTSYLDLVRQHLTLATKQLLLQRLYILLQLEFAARPCLRLAWWLERHCSACRSGSITRL